MVPSAERALLCVHFNPLERESVSSSLDLLFQPQGVNTHLPNMETVSSEQFRHASLCVNMTVCGVSAAEGTFRIENVLIAKARICARNSGSRVSHTRMLKLASTALWSSLAIRPRVRFTHKCTERAPTVVAPCALLLALARVL